MSNGDTIATRRARLSEAKRAALSRWVSGQRRRPRILIPRRTPSWPIPLTSTQKRLWFLEQISPQSGVFNMVRTARWRGALHLGALQGAIDALVERHEVLRFRFRTHGGEPTQEAACGARCVLAHIDLGSLAPAPARALAEGLVAAEARRPFALDRPPLLRVSLLRLGDDDHVVVLVIHHLIADGFSLAVLARELTRLYAAFVDQRPPDLAELPIAYSDYVRWQADRFSGGALAEPTAFWKERLGGELPVPDLPADRPRPALQGVRGGRCRFALPAATAAAVKALAREQKATPFMGFLTAFLVLLHRLTGEDDLIVGTPVANRRPPETESLVGLFINTVVLRTDLGGEPDTGELLARVRETALAAFAHQEMPFDQLVEALRPARDLSRPPLFQVLFVWQNRPAPPLELAGLVSDPWPLQVNRVQFDLSMDLYDTPEGVHGWIEYSTDLFDATTIRRMVGHFRNLVAGIAGGPRSRPADLDLLSAAERHQLLEEWNDTAWAAPRWDPSRCLQPLLEEQAARTPAAVAVVFEDRHLSFAELHLRANRLAHHLRGLGVGPEVRVGIAVQRSPEMVVGILGIVKAGGAYVPLDPSYPQDRLAFLLEDAGVRVLLTREECRERFAELGRRALGPSLPILCLDRDRDRIAGERGEEPLLLNRPDHPIYAIYTSGSTGRPKGVINVHRALVNRLGWMQETYRLGAGDRVIQKTPMSFDVSGWEFFWPPLTGATLVMAHPEGHRDSAYLVETIRREAITTVHFVPSMLQLFAATPGVAACRSLRRVIASGEALPADLARRFAELLPGRLHNLYGPTEAAIDVSFAPCGNRSTLVASPTVPIGRPISNLRLCTVDRRLHPVPIGVAGELLIGGVGLARGYHGRPALSAEKFVPDPFAARRGEAGARLYRTGDLVRQRGDGTIEFLGRRDFQVKIRGHRIELGEIEAMLERHPAVRQAVVVTHEHDGDRRLVAYLATGDETGDAAPPAAELRAFLGRDLPDSMVPAVFVALAALPINANGKVDRRALPAPEVPRRAAAPPVVPRAGLEQALAEIWSELLGVDNVGVHDNFFDLGGHSLLLGRVQSRLRDALGRECAMVELFRYPTVAALARFLGDPAADVTPAPGELPRPATGGAIAIVGMACRFPGAVNLDQFWRNLCAGVESITFFREEDLLAAGIDRTRLGDPHFVAARGVLADVECFDAAFFDITPAEAEVMDPQHRVFLEICWEALEHAGHAAGPARVGVFAGAGMNTYLLNHLRGDPERLRRLGGFQTMIANDKDFLATRVSYKLDLRGPSLAVQTACSTSLVATAMACQSLLDGHCDLALAGGASIDCPQVGGYEYREGGILSPDGHCRAFDAAARGMVTGNGAGVVVLRRLADALADGDSIHAVIKGFAINNDGANKVGYTAPGVDGQAGVIAAALAMAGIAPETVGYVEAHGTGTALGDPIEVAALARVFAPSGEVGDPWCGVGSVKTNIGHLDTAAGVAGLIKTVLALEHRRLPPSLHFTAPNPELGLERSPFFINAELGEWRAGATPRRAGVSSFGIGGTNVHVVLEEAPSPPPAAAARGPELLILSARTENALEAASDRLASHLREHPEIAPTDLAFTLQAGRRAFEHRRLLVAEDLATAAERLAQRDPQHLLSSRETHGERPVVFLFPGQGSQYAGMGAELYRLQPVYRAEVDRCCELLRPHLGRDLRELLHADGDTQERTRRSAPTDLDQTAMTQPALFVVEYALARLWMAWGIEPEAMIGHSVGEYVAATLAGVLRLEDALDLVALRGRLMQQMPEGVMLAIPLPEDEVRDLLGDELALAAVNAPAMSVVAGPEEAAAELTSQLADRGIDVRRLHTSHAFHSPMMEPILEPYRQAVARFELRPPERPFVSNLTGTWIRPQEAVDAEYWARHLRRTVRFAAGVETLLEQPERVFLEVGPGRALGSLVARRRDRAAPRGIFSSLPRARDRGGEGRYLLLTLGKLWLAGVRIDWAAHHAGRRPRRLPLPTYPFERRRHWVEPHRHAAAGGPGWIPSEVPNAGTAAAAGRRLGRGNAWLLFIGPDGPGEELAEALGERGEKVVTVGPGDRFAELDRGRYRLQPERAADYDALFQALGQVPAVMVHLGSLASPGEEPVGLAALRCEQRLGAELLELAEAWKRADGCRVELDVVIRGACQLPGDQGAVSDRGLVPATCARLADAAPQLRCRTIDLNLDPAELVPRLLAELADPTPGTAVAYRPGVRWRQGGGCVGEVPAPATGEEPGAGDGGAARDLPNPFVAPRNDLEERIAAVWRQHLGVAVGVYDDFFELGGHSLAAVQILSELRRALEVEVSPAAFFERPSVAELAELAAELGGEAAPRPLLRPAERRGEWPLSYIQEEVWQWHAAGDEVRPQSSIAFAWRVKGTLSVAALEGCAGEIVRRHEILRTVYPVTGGRPRPRVNPPARRRIPVVDLRTLPAAVREELARRLSVEEAREPFDLEVGPVMRLRILHLAAEDHVLFLTLHRIAADGWSVDILIRELVTLYDAWAAGRAAPLAELPVQYADYAVWQRRLLRGERLDKLRDYWRGWLAGGWPRLRWPDEARIGRGCATRGARWFMKMPAPLGPALRELSRREGVTFFMLLLGVFSTLVSRLSREEEIVVATVVTDREETTQGVIGRFLNTVLVRVRLAGDPPFREHLMQVREAVLGSLAHQELPLQMVTCEMPGPDRHLAADPIQTTLIVHEIPVASFVSEAREIRPMRVDRGTAERDLSLAVAEEPGGLGAYLEYRTDLFLPQTIERLGQRLLAFLEAIAEDPHRRLSELVGASNPGGPPGARGRATALTSPSSADGELEHVE